MRALQSAVKVAAVAVRKLSGEARMAPVQKMITLDSGDKMPTIGFGTWQASDEVLEAAVGEALAAGYRHIDTARAYENEAALGRALRRWVDGDAARRRELFVTTKLPPGGNDPSLVREYFDASLADLGLDYVDLYLIHTPFAFEHVPGDLHPANADGSMRVRRDTDIIAVWKELEKIQASGRARNIGVSNFNTSQLERVLAAAATRPACLQVEVHALCQQTALVRACAALRVPVVAYSPLGSKALADTLAQKTGRSYPDLLTLETVKRVAAARGRTPAQVLLRHTLQRGVAAIPKSTNPKRIKENITVYDWELSAEEMAELSALDRGEDGRICDFSFFRGVETHPEFPFRK